MLGSVPFTIQEHGLQEGTGQSKFQQSSEASPLAEQNSAQAFGGMCGDSVTDRRECDV